MRKKIEIPKEVKDKIIFEYIIEKKSVLAISKEINGMSYDTIHRFIKEDSGIEIRSNTFNSRRYKYDINIFDEIDSKEKAYWLGFLYADGYVTKRGNTLQLGISLGRKDKSHLVKFTKFLKSNLKIYDYIQKNAYLSGTEYSRVLVSNNHICEQLIEKGCTRNKTDNILFPSEEIVPPHLINHFIRGYFDGDGCLTGHYVEKKDKYDYAVKIVGTMEMLKGIHDNLPVTRVFNPSKRHKERDTNNYTLEIGGRLQVKSILEYFYRDATIYLDRKYEKYMEFLELS